MTLLLLGCAGQWAVEVQEVSLHLETDDGCSVDFDQALVVLGGATLGEQPAGDSFSALNLAIPGSHALAPGLAEPTSYGQVSLTLARHGAPDRVDEGAEALADQGASVIVAGEVTCSRPVAFELEFFADTRTVCELEQPYEPDPAQPLAAQVELARLFSDSLIDGEGRARAQPWEDADADADGLLTTTELETVDLAPRGYTVGSYSEATDLLDHVRAASGLLVTVPGAECTARCLVEDPC